MAALCGLVLAKIEGGVANLCADKAVARLPKKRNIPTTTIRNHLQKVFHSTKKAIKTILSDDNNNNNNNTTIIILHQCINLIEERVYTQMD